MSTLADLYDNHSDPQFEHGLELVKTHLRPQAGHSILDLGCGTGRLTMELASLVGTGGRVVGVDPNKDRVKLAIERLADQHAHVTFMEGFVSDTLKYRPFDAVVANFVLHWVPDEVIEATLREIYQCLKPGGQLLAQMTARTGTINSDLVLLATGKDEESVTGMRFRALSVWKKLCMDAGFEMDSSSQHVETSLKFPNLQSVFDFIKAYSNGAIDAAKISESDMKELLQRQRIDNADEEYHWKCSHVKVVATKPLLPPESATTFL